MAERSNDATEAQAEQPAQAPATTTSPATPPGKAVPRTRVSSAWTSVAVGLVFLIALLVFIFQNLDNVRVTFITFHGSFPLALSLLCSAIAGALIVLLLGVARMVQLRRAARRQRNAAVAASRSTST